MTWLNSLKIGDTVFIVPNDNRSKHRYIGEVTKLGRKYVHVTVLDSCGRKTYIVNMVDRAQSMWDTRANAAYGTGDSVYPSEAAYLEHMDYLRKERAIRDSFGTFRERLSADKIAAIYEIIFPEGE